MFMNSCIKSEDDTKRSVKIPYHAARMICKQMDATWLFATARSRATHKNILSVEKTKESNGIGWDENEGNYEEKPLDHKAMMEKRGLMPGN